MTAETSGPTQTDLLQQGRLLHVLRRDGAVDPVQVRLLTLRQMPAYTAAYQSNDEARLIELYTGQKVEWTDQLHPEGIAAILVAGEELNADFFRSCRGRDQDRYDKLNPGAREKVEAAREAVFKSITQPLNAPFPSITGPLASVSAPG